MIRCLIDRSNKIFSSEKQKEIERAQLRNLLIKNNYPICVIDKGFEKFLKYNSSLNIEKLIDNEIKTKYLSLPYIDKSESIAFKLKKLLKEF